MSLSKNEFEHIRLYAQKCDHRHMAPVASFGLAAGLRMHKDRGGRMFEKRKQRSDKYVVDESHNEPPRPRADTFPGPQLFAPHPAPWKPPPRTSKPWRPTDLELMDHVNRNNPGGVLKDQDDTDNLSDEQRLQKLYRILNYKPPEDLSKVKPMKAPKVDLKSSSRVPAVHGRNFNRNAKGWRAAAGELQETANPASHPMYVSVDDMEYYYYPTDFNAEERELFLYGKYKPRPKSWHSVRMENTGPQDEVLAGDYNPRPKAWEPVTVYDENDSGPREVLLTGDYNPRPKPWLSEGGEDLSPTRSHVQFGDYNPRPKAWRSKHGKGRSKSQTRYGDYNPRPEPWQSSERGHFHLQVKDGDRHGQMKFGDYNARPKAWKSNSKGHGIHGKVRHGDYNPRPKAWRPAPEEDDSSSSSYSSSEYSEDDYSYGSTRYSRSSIPACNV